MENVSWLDPISARVFVTTRWKVISACRQADEATSRDALAELCQAYWQPIYTCIRHQGYSVHDSQDLTQEFFVRILRGTWFKNLDAAKGRFRAYLSASLANFLHDRWRRRWTLRRGSGHEIISFDAAKAENTYLQVPATNVCGQSFYDRQWASTVIEHALEQLRIEMNAEGKAVLSEHFASIVGASEMGQSYSDLALSLGLSGGALRVLLYRWRRRFQALIRDEIARTVVSNAEIEDELQYLYLVFARVE